MSAAVVLTFPHARGREAGGEDIRRTDRCDSSNAHQLATIRRDISRSLLLLDIAVLRLRHSAPKQALELFAKELATIDELLDEARASARQI